MTKTPQLTVRKLNSGDLDDIMEIEVNSFAFPWSRSSYEKELNENNLARYFGVVADDRVVAFMGYWAILDEAHVSNIAVHPLYRQRGIGEYLMRSVMAYALGEGGLRMTLEVRYTNLAAQRLYQKLGFVSAGIRPGYYTDNDEDAVIMWADLTKQPVSEYVYKYLIENRSRND